MSEFKKRNKSLEGPSYFKKAGTAWRQLSSSEKSSYIAKAAKMGVVRRSGPKYPTTKPLAKAYKKKVYKTHKKSKSRKKSKSKSRKRKSKSRKRKSKSRKMSGSGYRYDEDDDDNDYFFY